jgi:hypothetical protein
MILKSFVMESNWIYLAALMLCCLIMVVIDYFLGDKAEFLNAWSVVVKLFRLPVEAPTSWMMQHYGVAGELVAVLLVNAVLGFILIQLVRSDWRSELAAPCHSDMCSRLFF